MKESDNRLTNKAMADAVERFFGGPVDFDPFGNKDQHVKAKDMRTYETRNRPIPASAKRIYANVPFSASSQALSEVTAHVASTGATAVCLVPTGPGTKYWLDNVWANPHAKAIAWLLRGSFDRVLDGKVVSAGGSMRQETSLILMTNNDPAPVPAIVGYFHECFQPFSRYILDLPRACL